MQCVLHTTAGGESQLLQETWEGHTLAPPIHFRFEQLGERFIFHASRRAAAVVHPQARPGEFCENLWRYDVVEFFLGAADAGSYLEFNLCPNGAWWAAAFTRPREPLAGFCAQEELRPTLCAEMQAGGWRCSAALPLAALAARGWQPGASRLAACAVICRAGAYTYLTTSGERTGKPDFHRPRDWEFARLTC